MQWPVPNLPYHPLGLDFQPNFERVVECHDGVLE
jgi:hypothetical protein